MGEFEELTGRLSEENKQKQEKINELEKRLAEREIQNKVLLEFRDKSIRLEEHALSLEEKVKDFIDRVNSYDKRVKEKSAIIKDLKYRLNISVLELISQYSKDSKGFVHCERLLKALHYTGEKTEWALRKFFDRLYELDNVQKGFGYYLLARISDDLLKNVEGDRLAVNVLIGESIVRYVHNEIRDKGKMQIIKDMARKGFSQLQWEAIKFYQQFLRGHMKYYESLDLDYQRSLELKREEFSDSWMDMKADRLQFKESYPLLYLIGKGEIDKDLNMIDELSEYESKFGVNLSQFVEPAPRHLKRFLKLVQRKI